MTLFPDLTCLFTAQKCKAREPVTVTNNTLDLQALSARHDTLQTQKTYTMAAYIPGLYLGASCDLNTNAPIMPPSPPMATNTALQKVLVQWPRMLLACHDMTAGMLALHPAVTRKTPKYCTPGTVVHDSRQSPTTVCAAL